MFMYIYIYIFTEVVRWSTKQTALCGCKMPNFGRHAGSTHCTNIYIHISIYVYTHRGRQMVHKTDRTARLQNPKLWLPRGVEALYQYVKINIHTYIYMCIRTEVVRWSTKQTALRGCKMSNFGLHAGSTHCTNM